MVHGNLWAYISFFGALLTLSNWARSTEITNDNIARISTLYSMEYKSHSMSALPSLLSLRWRHVYMNTMSNISFICQLDGFWLGQSYCFSLDYFSCQLAQAQQRKWDTWHDRLMNRIIINVRAIPRTCDSPSGSAGKKCFPWNVLCIEWSVLSLFCYFRLYFIP